MHKQAQQVSFKKWQAKKAEMDRQQQQAEENNNKKRNKDNKHKKDEL